jgi:oligopeptide/dipeptide ABC transporter ATP-binding protein
VSADTVLTVEDLEVHYPVKDGVVHALDGVSLEVKKGEIVAVVGESGCGKTTLAKAVLGLQGTAKGRIVLGGKEVSATTRDMASRVGMVWQDPYASLNPRWTIDRSIEEPAKLMKQTISVPQVMSDVGLDDRFVGRYPHQLSGGQRQRVAIGRALALQPPLVICDEPTSALDLSIRAQILNLLKDVRKTKDCAFLYISHDLMTVRFLADRIAVMYLGKIVETGPTEEIFAHPKHPYTKALLDSAPTLDKLMHLPEPLEGELPDPKERAPGCRFAQRCVHAMDICKTDMPAATTEGDRTYFCHNPF